MDLVLHAERLDGRRKRTYRASLNGLPDGTYVALGGKPWLVWANGIHLWSEDRYVESAVYRRGDDVDVLTPPSIVRVFAAGYRPAIRSLPHA